MPTAREHLASAVVDGELHVLAGRDDGNLETVETYDPATGEWRTGAPIPTARSGFEAVAVDGRVYAFGGESGSETFEETEAFDPATGEWETLAPMPTARHGLGAAFLDGEVYTTAGGPRPGFTYSGTVEAFDPHAGRD